ncbi:hypothetical protein SISNIDRAFT_491183 [Sistotremastrum niveocremeum HHB9708]|uniref:Uncharacterized protein n=1 Tax=Sistotremastrum niveocremeum HHB9708 TaxID=1314777 RepID=A0A164N3X9_9AGAM|nr:hypothetical protein SISNIDRAFT_491183 [Sistotremastrum niveocremeum HHB9708]
MSSIATYDPTHLDFEGQLRDWTQNPMLRLFGIPLNDPIVFHHIDGRIGVPLLFLESPAVGASFLLDAEKLVNLSGIKIVLGWPGHEERYLEPAASESEPLTMESLFKLVWAEARQAFNNGKLILRYNIRDHDYEARKFQISCHHPSTRVSWHLLHLHSLAHVGPDIWQAFFLIRNPLSR